MQSGSAFRGGMRGPGRSTFAGVPRQNSQFTHSFHSSHRGPNFVPGRRFDSRHHGRRYGTFPYAYPYAYGWYGQSYFWDGGSSSYDTRDDDNSRESAFYNQQYRTDAEINRLTDEIEELRDQHAYGAPPSAPVPQPRAEAKLEPDLPVVLVFLDKRIQEVKNYAVANETLVVLDGNRRKKYPLADIDLAATMKLNDERGVEFQVPNPVLSQ
jgi:hypothetical protein